MVSLTSARADRRAIACVRTPQILEERDEQRTAVQRSWKNRAGCPDLSPKSASRFVDVPVPLNLVEIVELVKSTSATTDRRVNVQIMEKNVEVVEMVHHEWISERIREHIVAVLVPRFKNKLW